ncbi:MAG: ribosome recycling factor [Candidatus Handelsmanbacteria bacterium RIFCSPLOWO2_12_FULL_64_10]|uniref:Ribosome-recycling factor n=1 Tax=Handelsmanbacteria sp. (strain RIFCSPLOWO2_12_FULL_64_10) TaxID=1817868 RepID=A0A1F6C5F7_HANXR|nr:MAG: ribosome recycling factor [Candidatus Handelsmanbacteria bacterium RIFCSPLOWO2_12_FULL_64_10]
MSVDTVQASTEERMRKSVEFLKHDLASIRTGRATPALLDRVVVDYYGAPTSVQSLAAIAAPEPRLITIQPYDRQAMSAIERAIQKSDLGLTPNNDGTTIRLVIPQLTDDRRRDLVKLVQKRLEEARVAVRNCRRDAVDTLRREEKEKGISSDELHRGQDALQKLTDRYVGQVDEVGRDKEREIMEP